MINASDVFNQYYKPKNHWTTSGHCDVLAILQGKFPKYYVRDNEPLATEPDYKLLKDDLCNEQARKGNTIIQNANELFKSLFMIPVITTVRVETDELRDIESKFGSSIMAHGVEEAKGGMYNLLLMCISNRVYAPSGYWGTFISGMPNISPLSHGPYYLIYNMPPFTPAVKGPNNPTFSELARILVPFDENKEILIGKLNKMVNVELITAEKRDMFIDKLVTYKQFLNELNDLGLQTQTTSSATELTIASSSPELAIASSSTELASASSASLPEAPRFFKARRTLFTSVTSTKENSPNC